MFVVLCRLILSSFFSVLNRIVPHSLLQCYSVNISTVYGFCKIASISPLNMAKAKVLINAQ